MKHKSVLNCNKIVDLKLHKTINTYLELRVNGAIGEETYPKKSLKTLSKKILFCHMSYTIYTAKSDWN